MNKLKNCLIQAKLLWFLNEKKKKERERYFFCLQTNPGRNITKKFSRHVECSQTIFSNIFRSFKK